MEFEWDIEKSARNEALRGISFAEAQEVFDDINAMTIFDQDHSLTEDRFIIIGQSHKRLLTVVYCEREINTYRIITAWKATTRETRIYEEGE